MTRPLLLCKRRASRKSWKDVLSPKKVGRDALHDRNLRILTGRSPILLLPRRMHLHRKSSSPITPLRIQRLFERSEFLERSFPRGQHPLLVSGVPPFQTLGCLHRRPRPLPGSLLVRNLDIFKPFSASLPARSLETLGCFLKRARKLRITRPVQLHFPVAQRAAAAACDKPGLHTRGMECMSAWQLDR